MLLHILLFGIIKRYCALRLSVIENIAKTPDMISTGVVCVTIWQIKQCLLPFPMCLIARSKPLQVNKSVATYFFCALFPMAQPVTALDGADSKPARCKLSINQQTSQRSTLYQNSAG
jgi:hypothetical protein